MFQNYALFPHLNVSDNVGFGLKMATTAGKRDAGPRITGGAASSSGSTNRPIGSRRSSRVASSSGSPSRARSSTARRCCCSTSRSGALDLKLRKRLQIELAQIHQEVGTTFVFVTHDQEEAMAMADRIAVMNEGRIEQVGTPEEIYRHPASGFVADFIGESNFLEVRARARRPGRCRDGSRVACSRRRGEWRRATLMIRPEDGPGDRRQRPSRRDWPARSFRSSFLGSFTRVAVQCDTADAQIMAALQGGAASQLEENATATVTWAPQDAVVLDPQ